MCNPSTAALLFLRPQSNSACAEQRTFSLYQVAKCHLPCYVRCDPTFNSNMRDQHLACPARSPIIASARKREDLRVCGLSLIPSPHPPQARQAEQDKKYSVLRTTITTNHHYDDYEYTTTAIVVTATRCVGTRRKVGRDDTNDVRLLDCHSLKGRLGSGLV
ncbi:hypothetical protein BU24DRAFT_237028 [Aaosphaeria arxii CBS 175.79]|uniref:Uncharacterized protein n=1 Tax=Aaosphaeria arxii CBS 175.79 TaxID=1450172 RepID=A0A6A5XKJ7_9PLEO|nr:uncharacterized protein BU24DRAFT_237028 [Aaosphaeria arxii CBS 175.79]KAF2013409.1 hypothetical protein BU24DRAFT_237028 [Aaosphaeria arxii CBS 175.79]